MNQAVAKIVAVFVLLLSLVFLIMEIAASWPSSAEETGMSLKTAKIKSETRYRPREVPFYPSVPSPLPDLSKGYLFNEQRQLEDPEEKTEDGVEEGVTVDLDAVSYDGSIIIGSVAKGLISYTEVAKAPVRNRRIVRSTRQAVSKRIIPGKKRIKKIVILGDLIAGFHVSSILPGKIVFAKGDERVEKILNDPDKKRIVVPPQRTRSSNKIVKRKAPVVKQRRVSPVSRRPSTDRRRVKLTRPRPVEKRVR